VKRHPSLQPLSDDHHRALVLARRLRRFSGGADSAALAALSREIQNQFDADLEPHFRVEERWLFPALEVRGAPGLAADAAADHARLRALARRPWTPGTAQELGMLLEKHVRFEERVVFPRAEALLSEAELASVRNAVPGRR
jgi:hypothetical protein